MGGTHRGTGDGGWRRPARPPVPAPCGAAPAASPGVLSCPGSSPRCPATFSPCLCPAPMLPPPPPHLTPCPHPVPVTPPSPPQPYVVRQHLPSVPIPLQCCPPERHVLPHYLPCAPTLTQWPPRAPCPVPAPPHVLLCSLWGAGTGPHPGECGHVPGTGVSPRRPGLCPMGRAGDGAQGAQGLVWWDPGPSATVSLGKPLSGGAGAVTAPTPPSVPAALPEHRGEARAEPTSGAEVALAAVLAQAGSRAAAWLLLAGQGHHRRHPQGGWGVPRHLPITGVTWGPDVTGGNFPCGECVRFWWFCT